MTTTISAVSTPFRALTTTVLVLAVAGLLAACDGVAPTGDSAPVTPEATAAEATTDLAGDPPTSVPDAEQPTITDLRQAHLRLEGQDADVRLTDGAFTQAPPAGQATGGLNVRLLDTVAEGDLNGDGSPDAVIAVAADSGGSGTFIYLAPYLAGGARPDPIPALLLGDRVQVKALTIADGRLTADLVVPGPNDPMCCPSQAESREYMLDAAGNLAAAP